MTYVDARHLLGVTPTTSPQGLRRAWRRFALRHHPDRGGSTAQFSRGREAYELLLSAPRGHTSPPMPLRHPLALGGAVMAVVPRQWRCPMDYDREQADFEARFGVLGFWGADGRPKRR